MMLTSVFYVVFFPDPDPPSEPRDVEIAKYDKSSVTLKWKAPTDDGGNPIKGTQQQYSTQQF